MCALFKMSNHQYSFLYEPAQTPAYSSVVASQQVNESPFFITIFEVRDSTGKKTEYRLNLIAVAIVCAGSLMLLRALD